MIRYSNRKTLSLEINAQGQWIVRAPYGTTQATIDRLLRQKAAWMEEKQKDYKQAMEKYPPLKGIDGERLCLLGEVYRIKIVNDIKEYEGQESNHIIYLPQQNTKAVLAMLLERKLTEFLRKSLQQYSTLIGISSPVIKIGHAKRYWGLCKGNDELRFTLALIFAPKAAVEYVVVHELCHIHQKNHSRDFWALVEKYDPDYRIWHRWLKENWGIFYIFS